MKVICLQENLYKSLSFASRLVTSKAQFPILGNILLVTDQERLKVSATNLETSISFWVGAKVERTGGLTVPAKIFTELVASFPMEKIDLEAEGDTLKISCGGHKAVLNGLPAKEFPAFPTLPKKKAFPLKKEQLVEAVSQVVIAASQDEGRPVLTGVRWEKKDDGISLAATDGFRLSVKKIPAGEASFDGISIVPARALSEIIHIAQEKGLEEGDVQVGVLSEEGQIIFSFGSSEVSARLIEGEFPAFSKIIPQGFLTKVTLDREAILKAIRVAGIFARDGANIVKWRIGKNNLTVSANSPQVGENSSEVEAQVEGEEAEIAFNYRFLLDFLNSSKAKEIIFETSGPLSPGVFKVLGDESFSHIIMPVRVQR